nr:hypothetical protein CFP56_53517 [Quercus suber]
MLTVFSLLSSAYSSAYYLQLTAFSLLSLAFSPSAFHSIQYLAVTELKVGGWQRTIIISARKLQQGWRTFGIELRRILEPSQYALGGLRFVPYRSKQIPKSHPVRSYVEAVKAPMQARLMHVQQPFINVKVKAGSVKKIVESPIDNSGTQVVVSETQAKFFLSQPSVVVRVEKVVLMGRITLRRKSRKEIMSIFL